MLVENDKKDEKDEVKGRILEDGLVCEMQQSIKYQENMVNFNKGFLCFVVLLMKVCVFRMWV